MYELTILSIMKNSMNYLSRYIEQVNGAFEQFYPCHLIITEGNSDDGTKERLAQLARDDNDEIAADITLVTLDTGISSPDHADNPSRWYNLEMAWNTTLKQLEPTRYAVCVESDLIWQPTTLMRMINELEAGCGDVMLPMLMRETPEMGKYHFDINAMRLNGTNFSNFKPYHPAWNDDEQFMRLDTGGGMLVSRGETLAKAAWKNQCVLHWPEGTRVVCDTWSEILHP